MPNPFGRPVNSKNRRNHNAGDARANSGRQSNVERLQLQAEEENKHKTMEQQRKRKMAEEVSRNDAAEVIRFSKLKEIDIRSLEVLKRISVSADYEMSSNDDEELCTHHDTWIENENYCPLELIVSSMMIKLNQMVIRCLLIFIHFLSLLQCIVTFP